MSHQRVVVIVEGTVPFGTYPTDTAIHKEPEAAGGLQYDFPARRGRNRCRESDSRRRTSPGGHRYQRECHVPYLSSRS
jgi:hypothetical protein